MKAINATSKLILASQSRYRKELLERLKLPFSCQSPLVDEESLKQDFLNQGTEPGQLALRLANAKAESVARYEPGAWVLGSDQLLNLDGEILGKAPTRALAIEQITKLSGRSHELISAWVLIRKDSDKTQIHSSIHQSKIHFRKLSAAEIARYVDAEKPFDCAGSYKMESLGISLVDSIDTTDFTSIIGLPLLEISRLLREIGFNVP